MNPSEPENLHPNSPDDQTQQALIHGLLTALAREDARNSPQTPYSPPPSPPSASATPHQHIRRHRRGRKWSVVGALATIAAAVLTIDILIRQPSPATASQLLQSAIVSMQNQVDRVYDIEFDRRPALPLFRRANGRLFIDSTSPNRVGVRLAFGPALTTVRFGYDDIGAWYQTPQGISRSRGDLPVLARIMADFNENVFRLDSVMSRLANGYALEVRKEEDGTRVLSATKSDPSTIGPERAEITLGPTDDSVVRARLDLVGPNGGTGTLTFTLVPDAAVTDADVSPLPPPAP